MNSSQPLLDYTVGTTDFLEAKFVSLLPCNRISELQQCLSKNEKVSRYMDELEFLNGLRVLVVDDDVDNLDLIKFILEEYNTEVIVATSVTEALQVMTWFNPDILISDIAMPNCDGYSLIRSVRNLSEHVRHIPAIALTGQASDEARKLALLEGFSIHIKKPFDPDELIILVSKLAQMASLKSSCGNSKVELENDGTQFSFNVA